MKIQKFFKKMIRANEFYVFLVVLLFCTVVGVINPTFLSINSLLNFFRYTVVQGIMLFAVKIAIISGGNDLSFPAIAMTSMFFTNVYLDSIGYTGPVVWPILMSMGIGLILGLFNGLVIAYSGLPSFIVTMGSSSIFAGLVMTILGSSARVNFLPERMSNFGGATLIAVKSSEGHGASIPITFLFLVATIIIVYILLNHTMLGRNIYAIGGDRVSAERAGIPIKSITVFVHTFIGVLSGLAGIINSMHTRNAQPMAMMKTEMLIIAACVLGGTSIAGGKGTVLGSILGLSFLTLAENNLIMLGVPTEAKKFVIGLIIVAGTGISAYQVKRESTRHVKILEDNLPAGEENTKK